MESLPVWGFTRTSEIESSLSKPHKPSETRPNSDLDRGSAPARSQVPIGAMAEHVNYVS